MTQVFDSYLTHLIEYTVCLVIPMGFLIGMVQVFILRDRLSWIRLNGDWVIWVVGVVGTLIATVAFAMLVVGQNPFDNSCEPYDLVCRTGWKEYDGRVFAVAGALFGIVQWLALRRWVPNAFIMPIVGGISGYFSGLLLGTFKDSMMT